MLATILFFGLFGGMIGVVGRRGPAPLVTLQVIGLMILIAAAAVMGQLAPTLIAALASGSGVLAGFMISPRLRIG